MGQVVADDGTLYTTLTAWEATVGTTGGPGGTCTVSGSFDDGGIVLDYTNNSLDDPSATFNYVIKGLGGAIFSPLTKSSFGIISIITDTTIMDVEFSGMAARMVEPLGSQDFVIGVDINLNQTENAALYRVKVEGIGATGGSAAYGIRCDGQVYNEITMERCYVNDVAMSGGFSSYGISINELSSPPDRTNKPTINVKRCTVENIISRNDASASPNESIGIYMSDASGYKVNECVSQRISASMNYSSSPDNSSSFCYGPSTSNYLTTHNRGSRSFCQSSDRTGTYAGTKKAINPFTGAPGRPDPAVAFNCGDEIHPLKIARSISQPNDLSINYVYTGYSVNRNPLLDGNGATGSIGAFGYYVEAEVGTGTPELERNYSTITTAMLGIAANDKQNKDQLGDTGPYRIGEGYLLGFLGDGGSHTDRETYLILQIFGDGEYDEQINNPSRTIGTGGSWDSVLKVASNTPTHIFAGIVFNGTNTVNRSRIRPSADGYGTDLFNAEGETVQNLEIDGGYGRFGTALTADNVHNCIVHGAGFESDGTIIESIQTGINATLVTSSLVYGEVKNGIICNGAYNNTVVLNNMSLAGVGITVTGSPGLQCKSNLVLTSGTHISVGQGAYSGDGVGVGSGNLTDSPLHFNQYFEGPSWSARGLREGDSPSSQYVLKVNSFAINSGVVPTHSGDYGSSYWEARQIWPYIRVATTGVQPENLGGALLGQHVDGNHWFKDGSPDTTDNRFEVSVSHSGFDSGWDERFGERTDPQPPFIAFMDF